MLVLDPGPGAICFLSQPVIEPPLFDPVYVSLTLLLNHPLKRFTVQGSVSRIGFSPPLLVVGVGVGAAIVFSEAATCIPAIAAVGVLVYRFALRLFGGGGGGGFGGLVGVLGSVGGFVESSSLAAFVGVGA